MKKYKKVMGKERTIAWLEGLINEIKSGNNWGKMGENVVLINNLERELREKRLLKHTDNQKW